MYTYARIDSGRILEIFKPLINETGEHVPMEDRFTAAFLDSLFDISSLRPEPKEGDLIENFEIKLE